MEPVSATLFAASLPGFNRSIGEAATRPESFFQVWIKLLCAALGASHGFLRFQNGASAAFPDADSAGGLGGHWAMQAAETGEEFVIEARRHKMSYTHLLIRPLSAGPQISAVLVLGFDQHPEAVVSEQAEILWRIALAYIATPQSSSQHEQSESLNQLRRENTDLRLQLAEARARAGELGQQLDELEQLRISLHEREQLEELAASMQNELKQCQESLQEKDQKIIALNQALQLAQGDRLVAEEKIAELRQQILHQSAPQPDQNAGLSDWQRQLAEKDQLISELEATVRQKREKIFLLKSSLKLAEKTEDIEQGLYEKHLHELHEQIARLEEEKKAAKTDVSKFIRQIATLDNQLAAAQHQAAEATRAHKQLEEQVAWLQAKLAD